MDVVNIKINKFGGLTKAAQARDLCVSLGIAMTIEDSWGGDIVTAAIAHLAHSTPEALRFSATDFNSYVSVRNATGAPQRVDGHMAAPDAPGLGITPDMSVLGSPVAHSFCLILDRGHYFYPIGILPRVFNCNGCLGAFSQNSETGLQRVLKILEHLGVH